MASKTLFFCILFISIQYSHGQTNFHTDLNTDHLMYGDPLSINLSVVATYEMMNPTVEIRVPPNFTFGNASIKSTWCHFNTQCQIFESILDGSEDLEPSSPFVFDNRMIDESKSIQIYTINDTWYAGCSFKSSIQFNGVWCNDVNEEQQFIVGALKYEKSEDWNETLIEHMEHVSGKYVSLVPVQIHIQIDGHPANDQRAGNKFERDMEHLIEVVVNIDKRVGDAFVKFPLPNVLEIVQAGYTMGQLSESVVALPLPDDNELSILMAEFDFSEMSDTWCSKEMCAMKVYALVVASKNGTGKKESEEISMKATVFYGQDFQSRVDSDTVFIGIQDQVKAAVAPPSTTVMAVSQVTSAVQNADTPSTLGPRLTRATAFDLVGVPVVTTIAPPNATMMVTTYNGQNNVTTTVAKNRIQATTPANIGPQMTKDPILDIITGNMTYNLPGLQNANASATIPLGIKTNLSTIAPQNVPVPSVLNSDDDPWNSYDYNNDDLFGWLSWMMVPLPSDQNNATITVANTTTQSTRSPTPGPQTTRNPILDIINGNTTHNQPESQNGSAPNATVINTPAIQTNLTTVLATTPSTWGSRLTSDPVFGIVAPNMTNNKNGSENATTPTAAPPNATAMTIPTVQNMTATVLAVNMTQATTPAMGPRLTRAPVFDIVPTNNTTIQSGPTCPLNQEYKPCGTACPPTCTNPNPQICTMQCVIGCFCKTGFLKDDQGNCVNPQDCPRMPSTIAPNRCIKPNQVFKECGSPCDDRTCKNPNPQQCADVCLEGCFCDSGLVKDVHGNCIKPETCPKPTNDSNDMPIKQPHPDGVIFTLDNDQVVILDPVENVTWKIDDKQSHASQLELTGNDIPQHMNQSQAQPAAANDSGVISIGKRDGNATVNNTGLKQGSCRDGWWTMELQMNDVCYYFPNKQLSFDEAETECRELGAHLPSFHAPHGFLTLSTFWKNKVADSQIWLGMYKPSNTDTWSWTDGSTYDYSNWCDAYTPQSWSNCTIITSASEFNYCWLNKPCSQDYYFFCAEAAKGKGSWWL